MTEIIYPLDDGIGFVELMDSMGTDLTVVNAARVSRNKFHDDWLPTDSKLINFLFEKDHGSPLEHCSITFRVKAPLFVRSQWERHRIACLPANTLISVGPQSSGNTKTIGKVYSDWKEGVKGPKGQIHNLKIAQNLTARNLNLDTGLVEWTHMVNVYQTGVRPLIRFELSSGHVLRCTKEHQIWTTDGWVQAGDLTLSSCVGRQGHVVTGPPIGKSGVHYDRVIDIRDDGEEMTYDIEMPAPWHNYVANNIFVHNSYNEQSGRWTPFDTEFYIQDGDKEIAAHCDVSYALYIKKLQDGWSKEDARVVLPQNLYTTFFFTINLRSLCNFLNKRNADDAQHQTRAYAQAVEKIFAELFPMTYNAFLNHNRKAP